MERLRISADADSRTHIHGDTGDLAALLFFGACFWVIAATHHIVSFFIVAILVVGPISIGSLLWMHNKVDRWAQSLIDEYSHAIANVSHASGN